MEKIEKYDIILLSGGFDPIHSGHIEMIQNAKKLATTVWVGINSDEWLVSKKGKAFMSREERSFILENIKGVDRVFPKWDDDDMGSAVNFIKEVRLQYGNIFNIAFGNGGDRGMDNTLEDIYCKKYNIDLVWGLGKKIQSSSDLLKNWINK